MEKGDRLHYLEIVFCGTSLYLCTLASAVHREVGLRVRVVDCDWQDALAELKLLSPEVLVVEKSVPTEQLERFLVWSACRLVVRVDMQTDSLEVLRGNRRLTAAVDDLAQVLQLAGRPVDGVRQEKQKQSRNE